MPRAPKRVDLAPGDIVAGGLYRAKRFSDNGFGATNDRIVIFKDLLGGLQYDSDTVGVGRHYPRMTVAAFIKWASHRVNEDGTEWKAPE